MCRLKKMHLFNKFNMEDYYIFLLWIWSQQVISFYFSSVFPEGTRLLQFARFVERVFSGEAGGGVACAWVQVWVFSPPAAETRPPSAAPVCLCVFELCGSEPVQMFAPGWQCVRPQTSWFHHQSFLSKQYLVLNLDTHTHTHTPVGAVDSP